VRKDMRGRKRLRQEENGRKVSGGLLKF